MSEIVGYARVSTVGQCRRDDARWSTVSWPARKREIGGNECVGRAPGQKKAAAATGGP